MLLQVTPGNCVEKKSVPFSLDRVCLQVALDMLPLEIVHETTQHAASLFSKKTALLAGHPPDEGQHSSTHELYVSSDHEIAETTSNHAADVSEASTNPLPA